MDIRYLGPLEASTGGENIPLGGPKQRLVLANLVLARGHEVSTDRLIDAVWGDAPPATARNTLQTYVSHLRRGLGTDRIHGSGFGYNLVLDGLHLDASRFEELLAAGRSLLTGDQASASAALQEGLDLWRGEPFGELGDLPSLRPEANRLRDLRTRALELCLRTDLELGRTGQVIGELKAAVADQPLREGLWELLMLALYRDGRQGDALLTFDRVRALLADELGADPSPRLQRLHRRILEQDPTLDPASLGGSGTGQPSAGVDDTVPFPTRLATTTSVPFTGREVLLEELHRRWKQAWADGYSQTVLLTGEPGIGKTRTAIEVARRAAEEGGLVLTGRCDEHLSVPYQPFVEMLDWQTQHAPAAPLGRLPGELVHLLTDLATRVGPIPSPVRSDPRLEEHQLYEAVASWLIGTSHGHGGVLLLDDLQWATEPTLRLLVHVARALTTDPQSAVLLLATYRDTDIADDHPLTRALGQLRSLEGRTEVLELAPLDRDEVAALVAAVVGMDAHEPSQGLIEDIIRTTEGNPFFVAEVLRHRSDGGLDRFGSPPGAARTRHEGEVPASVRQVVAGRVVNLSGAANEVLRMIAVLGGDAEVDVLAALIDGGLGHVLDGLDEALRARLVQETAPDRFRVSHALVRDTLLLDISAPRRRRLHAAIVDTLEELRPDDLVALATHALQAIPAAGSKQRAIGHVIAAGAQAASQHASADAARWYRRALELLDRNADAELSRRLLVSCAFGEAQRDAGDPSYRETLLDAATQAIAAGELDLAVRATLANHRAATASLIGVVDTERVAVLEALLPYLDGPEVEAHASARIRSLLSLELTFDRGQLERRLQLADEARAVARSVGDPGLAAWVATTTRMPLAVPARTEELAASLPLAVTQADQDGDPTLRCAARVAAHQTVLEVGDFATSRRLIQEAVTLAEEQGAPWLQMLARFNALQYLIYQGELQAAEQEGLRCVQLSQEIGESDGSAWWAAIAAMGSMLSGTAPAFVDAVGVFAEQFPAVPGWRAAHAMMLAASARHDEARSRLDLPALRHPAELPQDWIRLPALTNLATAAFECEDADLGWRVVRELAPLRGRWTHFHIFCSGPVEHFLGLALFASGHHDEAVTALQRSRHLLEDKGMRSHGPRLIHDLVRMLIARGDRGDLEVGHHLVGVAVAEAEAMGMDAMIDKLTAISG